jgi:Flp pilus assembly protein TadB
VSKVFKPKFNIAGMFGFLKKKKKDETGKPFQDKEKEKAFESLKSQLLKPKHLSRKEIIKRQREKQQKAAQRKLILKRSLLKAGIEIKPEAYSKWVFRAALGVNFLVALTFAIHYAEYFDEGLMHVFGLLLSAWLAIFLLVFFLLWLALYIVLDLLSYRRKVGIEDVFSDYLLLASTNIRAGMPIDKALWYAVRPKFGVLAKEIETVAKETMSGEELEVALKKFSNKYDSPLIKNTISLIIEGINAGGEMAGLLSKISENIQENKLLKKEMAAGISAYAIFIGAAALFMAPLLFALSSQLLIIISEITGNIQLPRMAGVPTFALSIGSVGVTKNDFFIFAFTNLFITSLVSAMIVSIIRKGEIKAGIKFIPIFVAVSLSVFYLAYKEFSGIFGSFI